MTLRRQIRFSDSAGARFARRLYYFPSKASVPAPPALAHTALAVFLAVRSCVYFFRRAFIAEPLFKAYCTTYGKRLHTGVFLHWVQGRGRILLGDDVLIDGKCSFKFATRYTAQPTLEIGSRSGIGHQCSITIGKSIRIGDDCRIARRVTMFDTPGHPLDPEPRRAGLPATDEEVKPIVIGNNVWLGTGSVIFPGVTIGDNSVVIAQSSVISNVPADTVVGGNPARIMKSLAKVHP